MNKKQYRQQEPDKYNGSIESKERLKYLFYIANANICDFINEGNSYVKYIAKKLNLINEDKKKAEFENYDEIFNRTFKILEYENIAHLSRLLFNVLVSFDAFLHYISSEIKQINHNELAIIIESLKPILDIEIPELNKTINLPFFISEVRNTFLHNGKYIAQFSILPNDDCDKYVPGLSIRLDNIFNDEYFINNQIPRGYNLDTIEVFNIIHKTLTKTHDLLLEI